MPFTHAAGGAVVKVTGAIDRETARALDDVMREIAMGPAPSVIVDISGVDEVNGALLGVLVRTTRWLAWREGRAVIVCARDDLRRGLAVAGIEQLADVRTSWPELRAGPSAPLRRETPALP